MQRRDALKALALAPAVLLAPTWLQRLWAAERGSTSTPNDRFSRTLVLIELHGGNDGLNTLVPFEDARYHSLRPTLAIAREQVLQLTPTLGFHPALEPLRPLWERDLAIVAGVGYPQPNRSHFRSIEIWETGSDSQEYLDDGWLARLFEQHPLPTRFTADAILLGKGDAGPLAGKRAKTIALRTPEEFVRESALVRPTTVTGGNAALRHIIAVQQEIGHASGDLQVQLQKAAALSTSFPSSKIGAQLETAARLLVAQTSIAVIKVIHGGFDTHAGQRHTHQRLLGELAQALVNFRSAMLAHGLWDRVLVTTYSEFGRRPAENGSAGTDHGTAAPHLLLGGRVQGGLYGAQPSLAQLQDGDLRHTVDYRSLYNTIIANWWGLRSDLFDQRLYPPLGCIRT